MEISLYSLSLGYNEKPTKPNNPQYSVQKRDKYNSVPRVSPAYFSPSFTAMKKNEFEGTDRLIVEKFKAPIQSFKTHNDFINWANKSCDEILQKDYSARSEDATAQRENILEEWRNYLYVDNKEYSAAQRLLILDGVTNGLNEKNDDLPPTLNPGILADTIYNLQKDLKSDPKKKEYNFYKTYKNNLRTFFMGDVECSTGTDMTGWVVIPSKKNDPVNFKTNVEKLKLYSHPSWCTKSFNAEPYLSDGDFHVYLENGKPKLGVRFVGNKIEEIQGQKNNGKIPLQYYDLCTSYIDENKFNLSKKADNEVKHGQMIKEKYTPLINELKELSNEEIFGKLGIEVEKDENGLLTISEFRLPPGMSPNQITFDDLGINLDELMKNVKEIKGLADFYREDIHNLPNLEKIGGWANFQHTKIKNLGKLKIIGDQAAFDNAEIEDLGELTTIGGRAFFRDAKIGKLNNLQTIGGTAHFNNFVTDDLSGLREIAGNAHFKDAKIGNLSGLTTIGRYADFRKAEIGDLSGLEKIGYRIDFGNATIKSKVNLKDVGNEISVENANIPNLEELKERFKDRLTKE